MHGIVRFTVYRGGGESQAFASRTAERSNSDGICYGCVDNAMEWDWGACGVAARIFATPHFEHGFLKPKEALASFGVFMPFAKTFLMFLRWSFLLPLPLLAIRSSLRARVLGAGFLGCSVQNVFRNEPR